MPPDIAYLRGLVDLVYFVILVGVLIFVHELGHFVWAKFFGVKVLKFSLGFGPAVASIRRGETEYVVAALPLGGYVRLLGEHPSDTVSQEHEGRSFSQQALWKRLVIVSAGPAMNLAFPVLLYFVVFLGDTSLPPPTIGAVLSDAPAASRLEPGDRIVAMDGSTISTWYDLSRYIARNAGNRIEITVERGDQRITERVVPDTVVQALPLDLTRTVGQIGITPNHPLAVVGIRSPTSPAAAAGLRTGDRIIAAGGHAIERWIDFEQVLNRNRGAMIPITYLRPQLAPDALSVLGDLNLYEPHVATLTPESGDGSGAERAGLESSNLYVARVTVGSPEYLAGIRPGDRLVSLDGEPIEMWDAFVRRLERSDSPEHTISWRRGDQLITHRIRWTREEGVTEVGQRFERYNIGISNWAPTVMDPWVANPAPLSYAIRQSLGETWNLIELTAVSIVRLFQGRLSLGTIGGPIRIYEAARRTARQGPLEYLRFMAFISINLGLLNLLPIPLLDGGHLLFFTIEGVTRRPVSRRLREIASLVGLAMLFMLMLLAFGNDMRHVLESLSN